MNTVTFNDSLPDGLLAPVGTPSGAVKDWLDSPIFLHQDLEQEKPLEPIDGSPTNEAIIGGVMQNPDLFPFRRMRMHLLANSEDSVVNKAFKIWLSHQHRQLTMLVQTVPRGRNAMSTYVFVSDPKSTELEHGKLVGYCAIHYGGKLFRFSEFPSRLKESYGTFINGIITSLSFFLHRINGGEFIAKVHPEPKGRSVEWVNARTHYVLLHKSHPANSATVTTGQAVAESTEHLKRQAHSRRAHDRILRSPRFRHKMGQKIRVKACWVGPLEWKQGTSIYALVKP